MKNIVGRWVALTCVLALVSGPLQGAGAVNLTGTWKLNVAKSDYGKRPKPKEATIEHKEPSLKYTVTGTDGEGKPLNIQFAGAIDGKEYPLIGSPIVANISVKRINDRTTESVGRSADGKVVENVTVTASADGKTFTRTGKLTLPEGSFTTKGVYEKQ